MPRPQNDTNAPTERNGKSMAGGKGKLFGRLTRARVSASAKGVGKSMAVS